MNSLETIMRRHRLVSAAIEGETSLVKAVRTNGSTTSEIESALIEAEQRLSASSFRFDVIKRLDAATDLRHDTMAKIKTAIDEEFLQISKDLAMLDRAGAATRKLVNIFAKSDKREGSSSLDLELDAVFSQRRHIH